MIAERDIMEKAEKLAATPDELLPGFPPMERAVILALKVHTHRNRENPWMPQSK